MDADLFLGLMTRGGMLGIVLGCLRGLGRTLGMGSKLFGSIDGA